MNGRVIRVIREIRGITRKKGLCLFIGSSYPAPIPVTFQICGKVHFCGNSQGTLCKPEVSGFLADAAGNILGKDSEEGLRQLVTVVARHDHILALERKKLIHRMEKPLGVFAGDRVNGGLGLTLVLELVVFVDRPRNG